MIKSITFDGKKGYIGERYGNNDKPVKPKKNDWEYKEPGADKPWEHVFNEEKYNADLEQYNAEMEFYKKHKGQYKVPCSKLLVGRKIEFSPDKINLIFGPNASGKTTVVKGMASHALCEDGFSKFVEVLDLTRDIPFSKDANFDDYHKGLLNNIVSMAGTSSVIEWDGSPVYYHNFENRKSYGYFGELTGSIIQSNAEEMFYLMGKGKMSGGENMFYQFSKLAILMSKNVTYEELLAPYKKKYYVNRNSDCWKMAYKVQEAYFKSFPMAFGKNGQNTYLFDEIDKSMDILNIYELYTNILPKLKQKFGKQIIIISHSPVVLKDEIFNSENYNIISMDEEYTKKCRELINGK